MRYSRITGIRLVPIPVVVWLLVFGCLPQAQAGRIVGRLTGPWGNPLHESFLWARGAGTNGNLYGDGFSWGGDYTITGLPGGTYHMAANSYGALRHVFVDNVQVTTLGDVTVNIQHQATMATDGNPAGITSLGMVREYGQTFVATGVELHRVMAMGADTPHVPCRMTVHEGGLGGPQIGGHRDQQLGQVFPAFFAWGPGELPLKPGQTYYIRVQALQGKSFTPIVTPLEDLYPNGYLYLDGVAYPQFDAYMTICCRDDGFVYDMDHYTGWRSGFFNSVGQTFLSLGRELRLATFLLANTGDSFPMSVRVYSAPGGTQIGPTKTARMAANGPGSVVWGPGEVPTTPGNTYYIELRRTDDGPFAIYGNEGGYPHGQAYIDGAPVNEDLRLTLISSETVLPSIPQSSAAHGDLMPLSARISWNTNVAAHGYVEFWSGATPPAKPALGFSASQQTAHNVTLTGLQPNTAYTYQAVSWRDGYAVTRSNPGQFTTPGTTGTLGGTVNAAGGGPLGGANVVVFPGNHKVKTAANGSYSLSLPVGTYRVSCNTFGYSTNSADQIVISAGQTATWNVELTAVNNLLSNGSFESGLSGWTAYATFDGVQGDGAWSVPSHTGGNWVGNISNGGAKSGGVNQQVGAQAGAEYTLSAFVHTRCTGLGHDRHGHAQARIGIDPAGGTDHQGAGVIWSRPTFTSGNWRNLTVTAAATGGTVTVFVETVYYDWWGVPVWYIAGIDDVTLTTGSVLPTATPTRTQTPTPTPTPRDKSILSIY